MRTILVILAAIALTAPARADVFWNEPSQGDLSNDRFNPTPFTLHAGSNQLIGFLAGDDGTGTGTFDRDYYSITIPAGLQLSEINCQAYFSIDNFAFIAIQPGPTFPNDPTTTNPGDLFGWHHLNISDVGLDILPIIGSNGQGFIPPLPAGTYSFWSQQMDDPTDYLLEFVVTPTPAPAAAPLLFLAAALRPRRPWRHLP